jgi:hypothetical protein
MSEPAAPRPEPERYEWREPRDREVDVLALVVTGVTADYDAATSIIETLDREQLVTALCLRCVGTAPRWRWRSRIPSPSCRGWRWSSRVAAGRSREQP